VKPIQVLMLAPNAGVRGPIPGITAVLAEELAAIGCDVEIASWGCRSDGESLFGKLIGRPRDLARVGRRISRGDVDIVYVHTSHEWRSLARDLPLLALAQTLGTPVVVQLHGGWSTWLVHPGHRFFKLASHLLFRLSDAALVLSLEALRDSQRFYSAGAFYAVKQPILRSFEVVRPSAKPRREADRRGPLLLFLGRLIPEKGIFETLEALALLREQIACRLLIVGDGACVEGVAARIGALGLEEHVHLAGYLTGESVIEAYREADVFVLPTRHPEGFAAVIVEAMAAGLPIVTTKRGGHADHLREGINALFVPPSSPRPLAEAIRRLLEDPVLRARMAQANRDRAGEFAPSVVAREYLTALEEVLARA